MERHVTHQLLITLLLLLFTPAVLSVQETGETVLQRGPVSEDLYVAGGRVDVLAEIDGDVIAAGGRVDIDSQVMGDVMVIGGSISVRGRVSDDVRVAGGEVMINAAIGDGVVAAGGNVLLAPAATVGGDALLSGGRVEVAGEVQGDLGVAGGQLVISGLINGDVELTGRDIAIGADAVIKGDLTYRSPHLAEIHPQARIGGTVSHIATPVPGAGEIVGCVLVVGLLLWLSLALTGIVLYLLFPRELLSAANAAGEAPLQALGLGLAVFAATPLVGIMLLSTGLGWLLAWLLMTVYALLLLIGFIVGVLFLGDATLQRMRPGQAPSRLRQSLAFMVLLLATLIVALIPLLGWLLVLLLLLFGVGGTTLRLYRARQAGV